MSLRPLTRCALVLALLFAAAAPAAAQLVPLDGLWFRLDVHAPGRTLNTDNLKFKKASVSTKAFLLLTLAADDGAPSGFTFDWQLWTKQNGKVWSLSDSGTQDFIGPANGDQIAVDMPMNFTLASGKFLSTRATLFFDLKFKKGGKLKKAKIRTLGGETIDGSANGADPFYGGCNIKGHKVKEGSLPFTPT